jgi:hypothetical protein
MARASRAQDDPLPGPGRRLYAVSVASSRRLATRSGNPAPRSGQCNISLRREPVPGSSPRRWTALTGLCFGSAGPGHPFRSLGGTARLDRCHHRGPYRAAPLSTPARRPRGRGHRDQLRPIADSGLVPQHARPPEGRGDLPGQDGQGRLPRDGSGGVGGHLGPGHDDLRGLRRLCEPDQEQAGSHHDPRNGRTPVAPRNAANDGHASSPVEVPEIIFERVSALCLALPEVTVRVDASLTRARSTAHSFDIRRRSFCLLVALEDPAGKPVPLVVLRADPDERDAHYRQ